MTLVKGAHSMKEWLDDKKKRTRKHRKKNDRYTIGDFLVDVLLWLPEIIIFPIRLLFWLFRFAGRFIKELFDFA